MEAEPASPQTPSPSEKLRLEQSVRGLEQYLARKENTALRVKFERYNSTLRAAETLRKAVARELEEPRHREAKAMMEELLGMFAN